MLHMPNLSEFLQHLPASAHEYIQKIFGTIATAGIDGNSIGIVSRIFDVDKIPGFKQYIYSSHSIHDELRSILVNAKIVGEEGIDLDPRTNARATIFGRNISEEACQQLFDKDGNIKLSICHSLKIPPMASKDSSLKKVLLGAYAGLVTQLLMGKINEDPEFFHKHPAASLAFRQIGICAKGPSVEAIALVDSFKFTMAKLHQRRDMEAKSHEGSIIKNWQRLSLFTIAPETKQAEDKKSSSCDLSEFLASIKSRVVRLATADPKNARILLESVSNACGHDPDEALTAMESELKEMQYDVARPAAGLATELVALLSGIENPDTRVAWDNAHARDERNLSKRVFLAGEGIKEMAVICEQVLPKMSGVAFERGTPSLTVATPTCS